MKISSSLGSISKALSSNDTGDTGAHQAGILVPKIKEILSFFPLLDKTEKNPRVLLIFTDDHDRDWEFAFIYYNNRFFGGTRNEFRLTRMTKYFKENNLKPGDELILTNEEGCKGKISYKRAFVQNSGKLKLSTEWKVISI